jgi:hypothetical protein
VYDLYGKHILGNVWLYFNVDYDKKFGCGKRRRNFLLICYHLLKIWTNSLKKFEWKNYDFIDLSLEINKDISTAYKCY